MSDDTIPADGGASPETSADPLAVMTAERDRYRDQALRSMADFDNYRKRARRDVEEATKKAKEDILRELLPVFDNLERALSYVETSTDVKALGKGIEMVLRLFEDTLVRLGGRRLRPVGEGFDPTLHEAIQQIESHEHPAGTVAREEVAGYVLHDRLLRPAMVVVSKGPAPTSPDKGEA